MLETYPLTLLDVIIIRCPIALLCNRNLNLTNGLSSAHFI